MEKINIETTQNVLLEYEVGSIGERIVAQIIDLAVLFAYFLLIISIIFGISNSVNGDSEWVVFLILQLPPMFYSLICEVFFHGQTLGKYIMKLKIVKIDGTQPSLLNYFVRWIMRIIDIWLFSGAVAIISVVVNGKGQRLGDIAAGTTMIKLKKKTYFKNSVYRFIPENYLIKFPEVNLLNDNDITIINDVLLAHSKSQNDSSIKLIKDTVNEIVVKTGIISQMHPALFLDTIIRDYNFIHKEKNA